MSDENGLPAPSLTLGVFQYSPVMRDMVANGRRIATAARESRAELLLTPELSLTGYDLRDDVHATAVVPAQLLTEFEIPVLAGYVEKSDDFIPYNSAALIRDSQISFNHRKIYLPTYGMFDEGRYFGRGRSINTFTFNGWRIGVLICEDMWHPMLSYLLAMQRVHAILVMAAAPSRASGPEAWIRIARSYAQLYGVYVVVCNRCGTEGDVTFAGESFVVAPDTNIVERAGAEEELFSIELQADAVRAARIPYSHLRDEDIALAINEMSRIHGSSGR
ncbi:MAG TPA: nitrilase-related carbon-nitrogen hydrolase [Longimicrobiales bacterium]|nr:nitrilase-related carbon-nitrogen hydrolase [Longimicrobiales bacterium]